MGPSMLFGMGSAAAMLTIFFIVWWRAVPRIDRARAMIAKGAHLIDVDTPEEFARDHIDGAANIPLQDLARRAHELGSFEQPIVVYGRGKLRAARAAGELRAIGFHDVVNVGRAHW